MAAKNMTENALVAVIGDEDIVTGFLLAGCGQKDKKKTENFLVVDNKTSISKIEQSFKNFTQRNDIAIILISQKIADEIRPLIDEYNQVIPTILEIPSKDHPYDPSKDSVMLKVKRMTGAD
ncbi:vacuolar H+ ATPase F subunit [Heterostelium album PN500]|uniref:V-type proton ATPase subunit F n=1 Tax=Heterostelium pallidum (strain ATCC 26659 / Pp 5 / PN500) TaxID=670386 RepID=D3AZF8_HETP5|nr:vacuolar H+ ATPase F subunit [Heterostelium album PN500]EFA85541.1 vacuolar H+ ATPase F subunit [Heterostelium album PN500]|eukprot:XP_020437649.1 vacuolar H+ ATPase F subunit [Heterostelium album PN500]